MPAGRPTKYKSEYCDQVIEFFGEGGDLTEFAVEIGVSRQTVYDWEDAHKEFLDALTRAREIGEAYWTKRLRTDLMLSRDVNAPLVKLYLANRFDMHDKSTQKIEATVSQVERVIVDPKATNKDS